MVEAKELTKDGMPVLVEYAKGLINEKSEISFTTYNLKMTIGTETKKFLNDSLYTELENPEYITNKFFRKAHSFVEAREDPAGSSTGTLSDIEFQISPLLFYSSVPKNITVWTAINGSSKYAVQKVQGTLTGNTISFSAYVNSFSTNSIVCIEAF